LPPVPGSRQCARAAACSCHRAREHNPKSMMGRRAPKKDLGNTARCCEGGDATGHHAVRLHMGSRPGRAGTIDREIASIRRRCAEPAVLHLDAGCPDRGPQDLYERRRDDGPGMNKYEVEPRCTAHPNMSIEVLVASLSRRLGALLYASTARNGAAASLASGSRCKRSAGS